MHLEPIRPVHSDRKEKMLAAALGYAARGWAVFPLRGKGPAISKGNGGNGHHDATTDPATIEAWWNGQYSGYNIGLNCAASGVFALDVDPRNGGTETLARLMCDHGILPETAVSATGGGGWHYLFRLNGRAPHKPGPGIDIKADGYIVLPPSVHPVSGEFYRWIDERAPAPAPDWLNPTMATEFVTPMSIGDPRLLAGVSDIRRALAHMPNDYDRDGWVKVAHAVKAASGGDEAGFDAFYAWCRNFPGNELEVCRRLWDSIIDSRIGADWLFREAWERGGYVGGCPFDPLPEAGPSDDELSSICVASWEGKSVPEQKWIVRDWLPSGYVTALYGDGGVGKSLLAQQLMTACAIGGDWLGLETTPCTVLGLFCEDDEAVLHRRQRAINTDLPFSSLHRMHLMPRVGEDNTLMTFRENGRGELTKLFHDLERKALRIGARLVVIDTAADTFGGNELVRREVRNYVSGALGRLAKAIDGAVLLCAHPSVAGMASGRGDGGNTAWNNTVRSRLYLRKPGPDEGADPNARFLERKKANYAPSDARMQLRWEAGVLAPQQDPFASVALNGATDDERKETAFLIALDHLNSVGNYVQTSGPTNAPKIMYESRFPALNGMTKKDISGAMIRLLSKGIIGMKVVGSRANRSARNGLVRL